MVQIDYQNPQHITPPRRKRHDWMFYAGEVAAIILGFIVWAILSSVWPETGKWQILDFEDLLPFALISMFIESSIAAFIYGAIGYRQLHSGMHFKLGVITGLILFSIFNFLTRIHFAFGGEQLIWVASFLVTPFVLAIYSKRLER